MPINDSREEAIFHDAVDCQSPDELATLLDDCCAGDDELRARVLELLRCHASTDRILDEKLTVSFINYQSNDSGEGVGSMVGKYKLLEQIGHGGMGVVYLAEQTSPVLRKVALKIIKLGMDTRDVVARFEHERQTLAMMDHPSITKVLDAGVTKAGRPYFVMDLVRGTAITEYCDVNQFNLRQRLELFQQVCNGVHHAHQKGIIHRDLKPSNVMVTSQDGEPLPKIIDFGIAKAIDQRLTEKTLFTRYGHMIGTPAYMSPEQTEMCDHDVDTRSDVYALGVLLYELLSGSTPLDLAGKSYLEMRDTIKNQEPECPSTRVNKLAGTMSPSGEKRAEKPQRLYRLIRGELDWVVMRCLAKDRNRRYETARDLGRDIQRYLAGDPVEAASPSLAYRFRKHVAKHRTSWTMTIAVALALVAGTVVSSIFAVQANEARRDAERERDRAYAAERQLAELNRDQRNRAAFYKAVAQLNPSVTIQGDVAATAPLTTAQPGVAMKPPQHSGVPMSPAIQSKRLALNSRVSAENPSVRIMTAQMGSEKVVLPIITSSNSTTANHVTTQADSEVEFLRLLLAEQRNEFGDRDPVVADTLLLLGSSLLADHKHQEAIQALCECLLILDESKADALDRAKAVSLLGRALAKAGKIAEGRHYLQSATSLLSTNEAQSQELRRAVKKSLNGLAPVEQPPDCDSRR